MYFCMPAYIQVCICVVKCDVRQARALCPTVLQESGVQCNVIHERSPKWWLIACSECTVNVVCCNALNSVMRISPLKWNIMQRHGIASECNSLNCISIYAFWIIYFDVVHCISRTSVFSGLVMHHTFTLCKVINHVACIILCGMERLLMASPTAHCYPWCVDDAMCSCNAHVTWWVRWDVVVSHVATEFNTI